MTFRAGPVITGRVAVGMATVMTTRPISTMYQLIDTACMSTVKSPSLWPATRNARACYIVVANVTRHERSGRGPRPRQSRLTRSMLAPTSAPAGRIARMIRPPRTQPSMAQAASPYHDAASESRMSAICWCPQDRGAITAAIVRSRPRLQERQDSRR